MALIEFKNLPDTTTPLTAENLNNNFDELNKINSNFAIVGLNSITVNQTTGNNEVGTYTVPEDGLYLIVGYYLPNYYGQTGRELNFAIKINNNATASIYSVISDAYGFTSSFCIMRQLEKDDVLSFDIYNSVAVNWAFNGGEVDIVKLK